MAQDAPLVIAPPPGVVLTESPRSVPGRFVAPFDNVRIVTGKAQKIGGWEQAFAAATSGQPRTMHAWRDTSVNEYIAVGTYRKLYVYDPNGAQNDITPFAETGTLAANPFATVVGTPTVTVTDVAHARTEGDTVIYAGSAVVNGIDPNGTHLVSLVTNANAYEFVAGNNASGTGSGGGAAVTFSYEINVGTELGVFGLGYGVGGDGLGTYGTARSSSTIFVEPRVWSLDNFGKFLLASYNGGTIYSFDPTLAQPWGRAQVIPDAPDDVRFIFVTDERFVFALRDAMVVSACTQGDYTIWTPADDNTAFSRTLATGTKLIGGLSLGPLRSAVWSNNAMYLFQYQAGSPAIYSSFLVARECGLVGPNGACTANGIAYWTGTDNLWMYDGSVHPLPNVDDVRKAIFDEANLTYGFQFFARYSPKYNEIWFGYTSGDATAPQKVKIFNITGQCFYPWTGFLASPRVSGTHFSDGDTRPYMGDAAGVIWRHETGYDAAGQPMTWVLKIAPVAMSEGLVSMTLSAIEFDFHEQVGDITYTVDCLDIWDDEDSPTIIDTETGTVPDTARGLAEPRVTGRYVGLTLTGNSLGGYMRMGRSVARVKQRGKRRPT